jgi:hypothetical protein
MQSTIQSNSPSASSSRSGTPQSQQAYSAFNVEDREDFSELISEVSTAVKRYCNRRPRVAAGCLFSLGFIFGWKLRPW